MAVILGATIIVGWIVLGIWLLMRSADSYGWEEGWPWYVGLIVYSIITLAVIIGAAAEEDAKGPCLREETGMMWNPSTKTMMPYTHCVERGEWQK